MAVSSDHAWSERYLGGSPEREAELLSAFARQIVHAQDRNRIDEDQPIRRGFHAKQLAGITDARLVVGQDVPADLRGGLFEPGATYAATVRLSNGSGVTQDDDEPDLRGIALRVRTADGGTQDLLFTNTPTSHARDALQFMASAMAMAGKRRLRAVPRLALDLGLRETLRMARTLRRASARPVSSLATEAFWSRAPFAIGPVAVKLKLEPVAEAPPKAGHARGPDGLREELTGRLAREDVRYRLRVLRYVDERTTPIEDAAVRWPEPDGDADLVAELVIPRQDLTTQEARAAEAEVDALELNPWNAAGGLRPIGGLNRARKPVYEASARHRARTP